MDNLHQEIFLIEALPLMIGQLELETRGETRANTVAFGLLFKGHRFLKTNLCKLFAPTLIHILARVIVDFQFLKGFVLLPWQSDLEKAFQN